MCLQLGIRKVRTKARIVEGDAGKVICREADRLKPAAVILGTRGRGLIQRYPTLKLQTLYISVAHLDIRPFWISFIAYGVFDLALYPANFASRTFLIIWSHNTATIPSKMKFRILHEIIKVVLQLPLRHFYLSRISSLEHFCDCVPAIHLSCYLQVMNTNIWSQIHHLKELLQEKETLSQ